MTNTGRSAEPFEFDVIRRGPIGTPTRWLVEHLFGLRRLDRVYRAALADTRDMSFIDRGLEHFGVGYHVSDADRARIPADGPLVVVANHPYGGVEGMILASVLRRVRPEARLLANYLLGRAPEMHEYLIMVNPFGSAQARDANLAPMKQALRHLRAGGALGVFPAGAVAHLCMKRRAVADPTWSPTVAALIRRSQATVLPVYFEGHNGAAFQLLGKLHPMMRTVLLPRELVNKRGTTIRMRIGKPISFDKLKGYADDQELTAHLRLRTELLAERTDASATSTSIPPPTTDNGEFEPIVDAVDAKVLRAELDALPAEQTLVRSAPYRVMVFKQPQAPAVVEEIGRLREITFRAVGEGTGRATDIDRFDAYYLHLVIWHDERDELVGAYRMGPTDLIVPERGIGGLYTSTLFHYRRRLIEEVDPALELGRSFVRAEYQRSFSALMLLWKGIGQYMVQNPRYKHLLGPVSINNNYLSISRQLIIRFLMQNRYLSHLGKLLKPRNPPRRMKTRAFAYSDDVRVVSSVEEVSDLIADLEHDHKGVPILLRQYLRMGAKLLAFNVDPDFGDVLDGLMLADLTQCDTRVLDKYMGKAGRESFLAYHRIEPAVAGA